MAFITSRTAQTSRVLLTWGQSSSIVALGYSHATYSSPSQFLHMEKGQAKFERENVSCFPNEFSSSPASCNPSFFLRTPHKNAEGNPTVREGEKPRGSGGG